MIFVVYHLYSYYLYNNLNNNFVKLLDVIETHVDDVAQKCLEQFQTVRTKIANELTLTCSTCSHLNSTDKVKVDVTHTEDILVAEVYMHICLTLFL